MPLTLTERELLETVRSTDLDSRGRFEYLVLLRRVATSASIPVLGESLGSSDPNVRATALRTLADLGGDEAVSLMQGALDSSNANTVAWAAAGLEKVNAVVAVPAIVRCLAERRGQLGDAEEALTRALGVLGDDRAVEELTVSAMQRRRGVRRLGLKALALIGTSRSEAALDGLMSHLSWRDRRLATRHRGRARNVRA
jgi:HEAT repeat protein